MKYQLKTIMAVLHQDGYIISFSNRRGKEYKLMDKQHNSIAYIGKGQFKKLYQSGSLKKNKKNHFVICRSGILRLRKNTLIKKTYKNERDSI